MSMSVRVGNSRPGTGRRHLRLRPGRVAAYLVAALVAGLMAVPILYVFVGGFRTTAQINEHPAGLPSPWVLDNYRVILTSGRFWHYLLNSTEIALIATSLTVVLGSMAAFALSRYTFRGRDGLYAFFTMGLLFPLAVASLPLYLWLRDLHLLESKLGVALPEAAFGLSITIIILRPFMREIPSELEDAALVDGMGRLSFFWRILVPLSAPALSTVAILSFVTSWNMYILPLLVFNDSANYTLPLGVAFFQSQYSSDTARVLAFTALSSVPTLVFFVFAQRRIVGALTGAVKG